MNISSIKTNFTKELPSFSKTKEGSFNKTNSNIDSEETKQKVYASNVCFKNSTPLTNMIGEYKSRINPHTKQAINSFLQIDAPNESLNSLLNYILNNEELSYQFFDSITDQVRSNAKFYKELSAKLPCCSDILRTEHPLSPYYSAYSRYIDKLYNDADSVSALLKIRPDWKEDVLLKKHRELYHNDSFEIGFVPDCIGKDNFNDLVNYLNQHSQYGFKIHKEIPDLSINGKNFKITALIDGKSDKNVFQVEAENGEKFIVKIASTANRSLDEPFALGTLAKIDTYLTRNNCRNSAPIRYYNHDYNVAIYDYINQVKVPRTHDVSQSGKKIPDFGDLGMRQNDTVGANNYFKLDESQTAMKNTFDYEYGVNHEELISVDNDHATFINILAPKISEYHKDLPNAMLGMFF